jgi:hypothetical protein
VSGASGPTASAPLPPAQGRSRRVYARYRAALGRRADKALTAIEEEEAVLLVLPLAAAVALALAGLLRLIQARWIGGGNALLGWIALTPALVLAALSLSLLVRSYWHIYLDSSERRPHTVGLFAAATTLPVCTVAFAGLTALLWDEGLVSPAVETGPNLWAAEQYYLWHLADAVPLLDAPETVGWKAPEPFVDAWSGTLLLVFKVLVIIPVRHVAVAGYRFGEEAWVKHQKNKAIRKEAKRKVQENGRRSRFPLSYVEERPLVATAADAWGVFSIVLFFLGVTYAALVVVVRPSSVVDRLLSSYLADGVDVRGIHVSVSWLQDGADLAVAAFSLWLLIYMLGKLFVLDRDGFFALESSLGQTAALCTCVAALPLTVLLASCATLALLHVGQADATPSIPGDMELEAALAWYAWHVADAIPILDAPRTLHWSLRYEFVDYWSGALLLYCKLLFFTILIVPITRLVRSSVAIRARPTPAQLAATGQFSRGLIKLHVELDTAQRLIVEQPDYASQVKTLKAIHSARREVRRLDPTLERVRALFGEGKVSEAGEAAISAAQTRVDVIEEHAQWMTFPSRLEKREEVAKALEAARAEATAQVGEFDRLAADALLSAAAPDEDAARARPS